MALLDLSVADDRFDPALIGATLTHIVEAWEQAETGTPQALDEVATHDGIRALLQTGSSQRRPAQDIRIRHWEVVELDASAERPEVRIAVALKATISDGDLRGAFSSERHDRDLALTWTLELHTGRDGGPQWKLRSSSGGFR